MPSVLAVIVQREAARVNSFNAADIGPVQPRGAPVQLLEAADEEV
jgi:hypothetical protein